jgi:hypothetical protein
MKKNRRLAANYIPAVSISRRRFSRQSRPCRRGRSSRPRRSEPEAGPGGTSCSHGQTRRLLSTASCPPSCTEMAEYINHMLAHWGQCDAAGHTVVWIGVGATKVSSHFPSTKCAELRKYSAEKKRRFRNPFQLFNTHRRRNGKKLWWRQLQSKRHKHIAKWHASRRGEAYFWSESRSRGASCSRSLYSRTRSTDVMRFSTSALAGWRKQNTRQRLTSDSLTGYLYHCTDLAFAMRLETKRDFETPSYPAGYPIRCTASPGLIGTLGYLCRTAHWKRPWSCST